MTDELRIDAAWLEGSESDPIERGSFSSISVLVGDQVLTELEDFLARSIRTSIRVSAHSVALWFANNWWRLRWEPEANSVDWRLSHSMAAIGDGFAWPSISFISDGVTVLVESRRTRRSPGTPIRFLRDADIPITAAAFEAGVDDFVEEVLARLSGLEINHSMLPQIWSELREERHDADASSWRKLEALLGFDPGNAPDELVNELRVSAREAGVEAVNEVAAAAKADAASFLERLIAGVRNSDVQMTVEPMSELTHSYLGRAMSAQAPWERAQGDARLARAAWGIGEGPVTNEKLGEMLRVAPSLLEYSPGSGPPFSGGLRHADENRLSVVLRAKVPTGRRFEILRTAADHLSAPADDKLLPITTAKTDRQKYQRAFASEFLLPFDELNSELGHPDPAETKIGEDDIDSVAEKYQVSPLLVGTTLVNKGLLPREALAALS